MSIIEQIRAEVERLKGEEHLHYADWIVGYKTACDEILSFLSTIQEKSEKPTNPVCEGLEEAAKKYADETDHSANYPCCDCLRESFKAGATWQNEQSKPKVSEELKTEAKNHRSTANYHGDINLAMEDSFIAGASWQKEQMMKGAVEARVFNVIPNRAVVMYDAYYPNGIPTNDRGVMGKLIFVKEEGK